MRHTNDSVQIELAHQLFLDSDLCVIRTKQETVRENDRSSTVLLQAVHNDRHEQVSSLTACEIRRKMILDFSLPPYGGFIRTTSN